MYDILKVALQNDAVHNEIKTILKSFGGFLYGELYFYVLIVVIYCGILLLFVLGIFIYLLNMNRRMNIYIELLHKI